MYVCTYVRMYVCMYMHVEEPFSHSYMYMYVYIYKRLVAILTSASVMIRKHL